MKVALAHWQRGLLILIVISIVVAGTVVIASLLVGFVFFLIEALILPRHAHGSFEDAYFTPCVVVVLIVLLPYWMSTKWGSVTNVVDQFSNRPN